MRTVSKLTILVLVLAFIISGCAPKPTPTPLPKPTAAPTAAPTTPPAKKYTFAMVTDQSGLGDQGFNDAAYAGMKMSEADFGAEIKVVESREQAQYVPNLTSLAEQKVDLIAGIGFLLTDAMTEVAPQFPDLHFALVDVFVDVPNVACLLFKQNEGSFLVGAIAGLMTKSNIVGHVSGIESPLMKEFESGFRAGVKTTNPNAKVLVTYTGTFADPAKGEEAANAQYDQGADVIYETAGQSGLGVINAAKKRNKYVIGVDRDKNYLAPENVITSMIKRVDLAVYNAAKMVADGTFKGGAYEYGVADGGVDLAPTTEKMVPPEVLQTALKLKEMIKKGEIVPPKTEEELAKFVPPSL